MVVPPPPPLELIVEVAPLTTKEAQLSAHEAQSPILMIQGVLRELTPKVEVVEAQGIVEEDRSSSTFRKEDVEGKNAVNEGQAVEVLSEQTEIPPTEPKYQNPIVNEESVLQRAIDEKNIPEAKDEAQVTAPPASTQQSPTFLKTLLDTSPHYDKLETKRPCLPIMSPLKREKDPFF